MSMANETINLTPKDNSNFFVRVFKTLVPWKGDNAREILRKIVFLTAIVVFVVSLGQLKGFLQEDEKDKTYVQKMQQELEPVFDSSLAEPSSKVSPDDEAPEAEIKARVVQPWAKKLVKRNSDAVGWIKIPDWTDNAGNLYINYPVLQYVSDDPSIGNEYYLKKNIDKQYYESGSIFADCMVPIDKNGQADNITIYGHHMRALGTAFTHLAEYKQGVNFLKKHPIIEFNTIYESNQKYVIIGCYIANKDESQDNGRIFDYWRYRKFDEEHTFENFISCVRKYSWYSSNIECDEDDDYISLQICSNEVEGLRWIITAKKMDADDNLDLIIKSYKEKANKDIYFPKCWRDVWGNTKQYFGWAY
ncbi:MAG: class B sortase [Ruminococcus sp.]|nr:class B sortase [Ruminococcus sp.]